MRTTLKRGMGRGAAVNGNGRAVLPPLVVSPAEVPPITLYRQPPPPRRGIVRLLGWAVLWLFLASATVASGLAGGLYLYGEKEIAQKTEPRSPDVIAAAKELDIPPPGDPAIALVVGYDKRATEPDDPARSDTLMLVRADPDRKTLSLLSVPRDLFVPIYCPGRSVFSGKINGAYTTCGAQGSLRTVRELTGLSINYLVTVNFRGFQKLIAQLGGVWMDVDRRYFNDNSSGYASYAAIDLEPGYQKLNGSDALGFVRYRHSDSDLYRLARQQLFVSAFKEALTTSFSPRDVLKIATTVTENVEVGVGGRKHVPLRTLARYAILAYELPDGQVFRVKLDNFTEDSQFNVYIDPQNLRSAVEEFVRPPVDAPRRATDAALGRRPREPKAPPPSRVYVSVLNGNGIEGSASTAAGELQRRGYRIVLPPNGTSANAPSWNYLHTMVYFDSRHVGADAAAAKLATLFGDADVAAMPRPIRSRANGAMNVVVVGKSFTGTLAPDPASELPKRQPAFVRTDPDSTLPLLRAERRRVPFPLQVPTVLERTSYPHRERPIRIYNLAGRRALRLTFTTGASEYWGIQMIAWNDAPILREPNEKLTIKGRRYELHYNGSDLHMVVLRDRGVSYWVVNTLLDTLSNETMLAIAKGLRPLPGG